MAHFTIFGAAGFVGRNLVRYLEQRQHTVEAVRRDAWPTSGGHLGHGVYCIGLTADFRRNPIGTGRAHVGVLCDVLERCRFESFLFFSSARIYAGLTKTAEDTALTVNPGNPDHLYNLTKLAGEAICLAYAQPTYRVVRPSNIIGAGDAPVNFLPSLIEEARGGALAVRTSPQSCKDYLAVEDLVGVTEAIALHGKERIYNAASGQTTSNADIAALIRKHMGVEASFAAGAPTVAFPAIDVGRIVNEFGFEPVPFAQAFERCLGSNAPARARTG